jgi:hypothetical protein
VGLKEEMGNRGCTEQTSKGMRGQYSLNQEEWSGSPRRDRGRQEPESGCPLPPPGPLDLLMLFKMTLTPWYPPDSLALYPWVERTFSSTISTLQPAPSFFLISPLWVAWSYCFSLIIHQPYSLIRCDIIAFCKNLLPIHGHYEKCTNCYTHFICSRQLFLWAVVKTKFHYVKVNSSAAHR